MQERRQTPDFIITQFITPDQLISVTPSLRTYMHGPGLATHSRVLESLRLLGHARPAACARKRPQGDEVILCGCCGIRVLVVELSGSAATGADQLMFVRLESKPLVMRSGATHTVNKPL